MSLILIAQVVSLGCMKVSLRTNIWKFPILLSPIEALNFYRHELEKHGILMVVAAEWRENPETGEEHWFEELTPDEFEDEGFLDEFSTATIQLWMR
jgi:hypothetical protein